MSDHDEFLRGFSDGSGLPAALAVRAYAAWLEREGYADVFRIDLESSGYTGGVETGKRWRETNQSTN